MSEWIRLTPADQLGTPLWSTHGLGSVYRVVVNDNPQRYDPNGPGSLAITEPEALAFALQLPEVRALVHLVRCNEWAYPDFGPDDESYPVLCPSCKRDKTEGHRSDCPYAAALSPFEALEAGE